MTRSWPTSADSWLDPRLVIRPSPLHGRGTYAVAAVGVGEIVTVWVHRELSAAELADAPPGTVSPRANDRWLWQPLDDHDAPDYLLNHGCDPSLGMADEVTLVARRAITAGEELTIDYAMISLDPEWRSGFICRCGARECRGTITGRDWERVELQSRYAGLFHPTLAARIAQSKVAGGPA